MYSQPAIGQVFDTDSSDPLNPTVNYTHFHPSPEQQDPHVPLGFKVYGIGCLAAFLTFLLLVVIYVVFNNQIRRFRNCQGEKGKRGLRNLGKPSLPNALENGLEVGASSEKSHVAAERAIISPRPHICTASSYEAENVRWRGKTRDVGSWDSSVTMVNTGSPRIPPSSHLSNFNEASPRTYSPIFSANMLVPTPNTSPIPVCVPRLDTPVSPKTMPMVSNYVSPAEPGKAMTADWAYRTMTPPRRSAILKPNGVNQEKKRADNLVSEVRSVPLTRNPGSSPKGILKTSPTYVARNSSKSPLHLSSPDDVHGPMAPTLTGNEDDSNAHSSHPLSPPPARAGYHSRNESISSRPISDEIFPSSFYGKQKVQKFEEARELNTEYSRSDKKHNFSNNDGRRQSSSPRLKGSSSPSGMIPIASSSTLESHIVHLGPNPKQSSCGQSCTPTRRVSISVPSKNSINFIPGTRSALATCSQSPPSSKMSKKEF
ncbi:hypothetical protein AX15_003343 [Amanita polypyramis BW_CC]|nr:hypothetical protein AX15_003343 [Amanita polypyramis BW_CC]